jgi:monolysocardiolipin acyltransferase
MCKSHAMQSLPKVKKRTVLQALSSSCCICCDNAKCCSAPCRQFFLNGKVLPVERGAGVNQSSVSVAARALGNGDWLHIFPEGRVVPSGQVGPFRQGIGKLICEARAVQGR